MLEKLKAYWLSLNLIVGIMSLILTPALAIPSTNLPNTGDNNDPSFHWNANNKVYQYSCKSDAVVEEESKNSLKLSNGLVLVVAKSDCSVVLPLGTLNLKRGSAVLCEVRDDRDIFSIMLESGKLVCGQDNFKLFAGNRVWLFNPNNKVRYKKTNDNIGVRQVTTRKLSDGTEFTCAEYSLIQTLQQNPLVASLMHSSDKHNDGLKDKLIKAAAVLDFVTQGHGRFFNGYY